MKKRGKYKEYDFLELPAEEAEKLIEAMKKAEQENDRNNQNAEADK